MVHKYEIISHGSLKFMTPLESKKGDRSFLLLRKDFSVANLYHQGSLSLEKLVVLQKNNSGNFHTLSIKTFSLADLEQITDEFMNKPKQQLPNRGNWSREECFHKYISYVIYENVIVT